MIAGMIAGMIDQPSLIAGLVRKKLVYFS